MLHRCGSINVWVRFAVVREVYFDWRAQTLLDSWIHKIRRSGLMHHTQTYSTFMHAHRRSHAAETHSIVILYHLPFSVFFFHSLLHVLMMTSLCGPPSSVSGMCFKSVPPPFHSLHPSPSLSFYHSRIFPIFQSLPLCFSLIC